MVKTVYYVANLRWPTERAHGVQVAKMVEAMVVNGLPVVLVIPRKANKIKESAQKFYGLKVDIPVVSLPVIELGYSRWGFNLSALSFSVTSFVYLLWRRLNTSSQSAIIYSIDLDQFSNWPLVLLGWPVFVELHGSKRYSWRSNFFYRRVKKIIAVSIGVKQNMQANFKLEPQKLTVEPNGIDWAMFDISVTKDRARQQLALPPDVFIFLYIGKFYDWKGLDTLIKSASNLPPKAVIYLVGGESAELSTVTQIQNIPKQMSCFGQRLFSQIPLWLKAADCLLVTGTKRNHYSFFETSPMKLFEYLASRRPIIAAATPAIQSVVTDKEVLFYVPDDARHLSAVMSQVYGDYAKLDALTGQAYHLVKTLNWDARAKRVIALMDSSPKIIV